MTPAFLNEKHCEYLITSVSLLIEYHAVLAPNSEGGFGLPGVQHRRINGPSPSLEYCESPPGTQMDLRPTANLGLKHPGRNEFEARTKARLRLPI